MITNAEIAMIVAEHLPGAFEEAYGVRQFLIDEWDMKGDRYFITFTLRQPSFTFDELAGLVADLTLLADDDTADVSIEVSPCGECSLLSQANVQVDVQIDRGSGMINEQQNRGGC